MLYLTIYRIKISIFSITDHKYSTFDSSPYHFINVEVVALKFLVSTEIYREYLSPKMPKYILH